MPTQTENPLPNASHIGRVALTVASLDDVVPFYRDVLGLSVSRDGARARVHTDERTLLVLSEDPDAPARPDATAGLFHVAIRVPDRGSLGDVLVRSRRAGDEQFSGASDHVVSEALYFRDPEGNGVEVYRDRSRESWPRTDEGVSMETRPLDRSALVEAAAGRDALPPVTDVGHVHLEVTDLDQAEAFYVDEVGFDVMSRYGDDATFVAAGGYHHHLGLNVWNHRTEPASDTCGLDWFEVVVPDAEDVESVERRLTGRLSRIETGDGIEATDSAGIVVRFVPGAN